MKQPLVDDLIVSVCEHLTIYEIQDKLFDCGNVRLRQLIQDDEGNKKWLLDHHVITQPHGVRKEMHSNYYNDGKYMVKYNYWEGRLSSRGDVPQQTDIYMTRNCRFSDNYRSNVKYGIPVEILEDYYGTESKSNCEGFSWSDNSLATLDGYYPRT